MELIAEFDPVLKDDLIRCSEKKLMGKKLNSYLTHMNQNELIVDMEQHIQNNIVDLILHAKCYFIILDRC